MKKLELVATIKGAEDVTIIEKRGVSLSAIPALVELLTPDESYLEIKVKQSDN